MFFRLHTSWAKICQILTLGDALAEPRPQLFSIIPDIDILWMLAKSHYFIAISYSYQLVKDSWPPSNSHQWFPMILPIHGISTSLGPLPSILLRFRRHRWGRGTATAPGGTALGAVALGAGGAGAGAGSSCSWKSWFVVPPMLVG